MEGDPKDASQSGENQNGAFGSLCREFENQLTSGRQPTIEQFLNLLSDPDEQAVFFAELLKLELRHRWRCGLPCPAYVYLGRFPQYTDQVRKVYLALTLEMADSVSSDAMAHATHSIGPDSSVGERALKVLPLPEPSPEQEEILGRYRLIEPIGRGGMGCVYKASHTLIHRVVAVKLLNSDLAMGAGAIQRFLSEAQASVNLVHPNIVTTYDVDRDGDRIFIIMELIEGQDLAKYVAEHGPLPIEEAARFIEQAARGLDYAHRLGIVHRDIKPHNLMLARTGQIKILDLGLARILDDESNDLFAGQTGENSDHLPMQSMVSRLTSRGVVLGTLPYIAPEQARDSRSVTARSDIYSLGCTFYYLLTARHAFVGKSVAEILDRHLTGSYPPVRERRPEIPEEVEGILKRMMAREPDERYASMAEVAAALGGWLNTGDMTGRAWPNEQEDYLRSVDRMRAKLVELDLLTIDEARNPELKQNGSPLGALFELQRLRRFRTPTNQLSDFQMEQVIAGKADLLRVHDYILVDRVGQGWKGELYKARRTGDPQSPSVAIRLFRPDQLVGLAEPTAAAFDQHFLPLRRMEHPGIPKVLETGKVGYTSHGRYFYLVTEFIEGRTVRDIVTRSKQEGIPVPLQWSVDVMIEVMDILIMAHRNRIAHLDLNPQSLIVTSTDRVKVLDLGIARLLIPLKQDENAMVASSILGTPTSIPPERWIDWSATSPSTDVYGLGCTFYYMLTGRHPFNADNLLQLVRQHFEAYPVDGPDAEFLPNRLQLILSNMLAKKVEERYPDVVEVFDELISYRTSAKRAKVSMRPQPVGTTQEETIHVVLPLVAAILFGIYLVSRFIWW